ncbi:type I polyketide synthase [Streptomyces nitrosporeus]|uniref:type I polyketide synthase n=1 Tax=Streptomyces nitrosporeus TaxID=28894 RepID=UPI00331AC0C7
MRDRSLDIAVTGAHARLPGPGEPDKWWAAVCAGEVLTSRLERHALAAQGVPEHVLADPSYVPVRGTVRDSDRFDAELFGISPREAELMDPQHRLMLEAGWAALEDAGCAPSGDALRTAVFASSSPSRYMARVLGNPAVSPETLEALSVGAGRDFMATRLAYRLGLRGPAISVLTACSSSLVAVHLAVQAINNGDCDQALVVAASVGFPQGGYTYVRGGIMAPDGVCRPFDAGAGGTVGGSGVVAVVLRRFEDLGPGQPALGVILGSAVNNDGAEGKAGFSAPSVQGQAEVIKAALRAGDVPAASLGYLETHGTGTYVGDPIEWTSTSRALRESGADGARIAVGALKANVGHLDATAGLAALYKTLQVLKHGQVPPVANFTALNPMVAGLRTPLYVPAELGRWQGPEPRRAGVSSFGIGGTNAHVVVEAAPPPRATPPGAGRRPSVVVLSAVRDEALLAGAARLSEHLCGQDEDLADVAHTLRVGRAGLLERMAVVGSTRAEVAEALRGGGRRVRGRAPREGAPPLVFLLPGQGAQRPGMALPFLRWLPGFGAALEECLGHLEPGLEPEVRRALHDPDFPAARLRETRLAQPALFALEYAAARALAGVGLRPAALAGHSLGEVTAGCLAGVLDLRTAVEFVTLRARAMHDCAPGAMLALTCSGETARELLAEARSSGAGELSLAAVNGPESCTVSGPAEAVAAFGRLVAGRVDTRPLRTAHAFHSPATEGAARILRSHLADRTGGQPSVPFVANARGDVVAAGTRVPLTLFADSVSATVRFADGLAAVRALFPGAIAVEVGPGQALTGMAAAAGWTSVALAPGKHGDDEPVLGLAELWTYGLPVELAALVPSAGLAHLPGTVFGGGRHTAPEARWETAAPAPATPGAPGAPRSRPAEAAVDVAAAWAELLGHTGLPADADFFELGGDSLTSVRLARRLEERFGVEVPLRDLVLARTLGGQIRLVERLTGPSALEASDE